MADTGKVAPLKKPYKEHKKLQRVSCEEIKSALLANVGVIALAAAWLGKLKTEQKKAECELLGIPFDENKDTFRISRQAISKRIERNAELKEVVVDLEETKLDLAEKYLYDLMKGGNLGAICFYLKCKGKRRGWIERQELTGADGETLSTVGLNIAFTDKAGAGDGEASTDS